jgi:23S rRNA (cytidine2498-2'-O)-methyltransferase
LQQELQALGLPLDSQHVLAPGLVAARHASLPSAAAVAQDPQCLKDWQPVWALQVLPNITQVSAPSIAEWARLLVATLLAAHGNGAEVPTWDLHVLVVGQLRGQPKPVLYHRAELIAVAVSDLVRKSQPQWRRQRQRHGQTSTPPKLLVQLLLQEPDRGLMSVSPVVTDFAGVSWPARIPAGLAPVADDDTAPASAFRKLEEAIWLLGISPKPGQTAVDLGASPGSWTHVLRRYGAEVYAIDRAPLAPHLQRDPLVHAEQGDAFRWLPQQPVDWLVSDIIAFPERVAELLQMWCSGGHMQQFVVQCKFRGEPNWPALEAALTTARRHGYDCVARHVFNDKNEATLVGLRRPLPAPVGPELGQE